MLRNTLRSAFVVLMLLGAQVASAAIVTNLRMDDTVSPFTIVNNAEDDFGLLGITVRNPTAEAKDVAISLPMSLLDAAGAPAGVSPGWLSLRTLTNPATDFTYEQMSLPPPGKVFNIEIPVIDQAGTVYEGSLNWGVLSFTLAGIAIEPQASAFLAIDYRPANDCSLIAFLNDGMVGPNLAENLDSAWVATAWFTGDLASDRVASGFGANSYAVLAYELVPVVPEPAVGALWALVSTMMLARRKAH